MPAKKIALSLFVIAASGAYVWAQAGQGSASDLVGSALPAGDAQSGNAPRRIPPTAFAPPTPTLVPLFATEPIGSRSDEGIKVAGALATETSAPRLTAPPTQTLPVTEPQLPPAQNPAAPAIVADTTALPAPSTKTASIKVASIVVPIPRPRPAYHTTRTSVTQAAVTLAASKGRADGAFTGPAVDAYYGLVQVQAIVQGGRLVEIKVLQYPSHRRTSVAINRQALPMLRDEVITAQSADVDIISGATLTSEAFIRSLGAALRQGSA